MMNFEGGCAVVTGGAGLLGKALCRALADKGMDVVVADLNAEAVAAVVGEVEARGREALGCFTDVADATAMERLAEDTYQRFGKVNLLCLNAGTSVLKPVLEQTREDWDKVLGVQFYGVLNGMLSFLPRMKEQDGERHVLITSSMSGVGRADLRPLNAPYVTAKFAVVGMAECFGPALAEHGIGVSVLCPGMTVADPSAMKGAQWPMASAAWYQDNLLDAEAVALETVRGIGEGRSHIFPHHAGRQEVIDRHAMLMHAFDQAAR